MILAAEDEEVVDAGAGVRRGLVEARIFLSGSAGLRTLTCLEASEQRTRKWLTQAPVSGEALWGPGSSSPGRRGSVR